MFHLQAGRMISPDSQSSQGIAEKWALTIFHCPLCLRKTKVVRPWMDRAFQSLVTPVNMS
jgi:hypothetical protein